MEFRAIERAAGAFQQPVTAEEVRTMCRRAFGAQVDVLSAIELGDGSYNTTYRVDIGAERPVILRIASWPRWCSGANANPANANPANVVTGPRPRTTTHRRVRGAHRPELSGKRRTHHGTGPRAATRPSIPDVPSGDFRIMRGRRWRGRGGRGQGVLMSERRDRRRLHARARALGVPIEQAGRWPAPPQRPTRALPEPSWPRTRLPDRDETRATPPPLTPAPIVCCTVTRDRQVLDGGTVVQLTRHAAGCPVWSAR